jgi:hypothetical protein
VVKFVHELCQPVRNRHLIQRPLRICLENPNKPHLECVGSGQNRAKISYLTLLTRKLQAIKNPPSFFHTNSTGSPVSEKNPSRILSE